MIFKEVLFEAVNVEKLYKSQMNGLNDKSIPEVNLITFSSLFKKEAKEAGLQKEFIQSYLESAKILSKRLEELQPQMGITKVFYSYSLTLPIIYLCRHCLELSIKYAISRINGKPKYVHGLDKVWSSFLSYLPPENYSEKEKSLLKSMKHFVQDIDLLDDTGTKLRYPLEQDKTCTENKFKWANSKLIVDTTEKFVKQLELLDIG